MLKQRVIAVVIVREGSVVQSEAFSHPHVIHYDAYHAIEAFNSWSVDEIVLLNVSLDPASREEFLAIVSRVSRTCFVPLAVGGWIDSEDYGARLIESGADKLVLNSAWSREVQVPQALSTRFGRQCIVASIDAKSVDGEKRVFIDRGREDCGISALERARFCVAHGAGEVLFNNIDHDGMRGGYDCETIRELAAALDVPVIAFGGVADWKHMAEGLEAGADAVAAANIFHYKELAAKVAKRYLTRKGFKIRKAG